VVCGSKTWSKIEMDMKQMGTWEWKILRRIYGSMVEQGMWRLRTNEELRELYKDLYIVADIERKLLELIGHVVRKDQGRTVKKIFGSKGKGKAAPLQAWTGPEDSRKLGFPDFMTTAQGGDKVVSLTHRPHLPPGNSPGTHFC